MSEIAQENASSEECQQVGASPDVNERHRRRANNMYGQQPMGMAPGGYMQQPMGMHQGGQPMGMQQGGMPLLVQVPPGCPLKTGLERATAPPLHRAVVSASAGARCGPDRPVLRFSLGLRRSGRPDDAGPVSRRRGASASAPWDAARLNLSDPSPQLPAAAAGHDAAAAAGHDAAAAAVHDAAAAAVHDAAAAAGHDAAAATSRLSAAVSWPDGHEQRRRRWRKSNWYGRGVCRWCHPGCSFRW